MKLLKLRYVAPVVFALFLGFSSVASARSVVVNGVLLGPVDIAVLQWIHGEYIPDGRYWLDFTSGIWGYEGGPAHGIIGQDNDTQARSGCGGQFAWDCQRDSFCEENPSICSPIL